MHSPEAQGLDWKRTFILHFLLASKPSRRRQTLELRGPEKNPAERRMGTVHSFARLNGISTPPYVLYASLQWHRSGMLFERSSLFF